MADDSTSLVNASALLPPANTSCTPQPKMVQLGLFENVLGGNTYTQSTEFYDLAPKMVIGSPVNPETGEKLPAGQKYYPTQVREFHFKGKPFVLEITPARIQKRGGSERDMFPGQREQFVEAALRRIAVTKRRTNFDGEMAGVTFTWYELRKELESHGHGFPTRDLKEAVRVMNKANLTIRSTTGESLVASTYFPSIAIDGAGEDGKAYVGFNPLVTQAIMRLDFRQLNYITSMSFTSEIARYLHQRMTLNYTQANWAENTFNILASTIIRDSRLCNYGRPRDAFNAITKAIQELKKKENDVIISFTQEDKFEGPKRVDVLYKLTPSIKFTDEMRIANKVAADNINSLQAVETPSRRTGPIDITPPSRGTRPAARSKKLRAAREVPLLASRVAS